MYLFQAQQQYFHLIFIVALQIMLPKKSLYKKSDYKDGV